MRYNVLLFAGVCLMPGFSAFGAFDTGAADPRTSVIGCGPVPLPVDAWSVFRNPAELAVARPFIVGFFYTPGLFGLEDLQVSAGAVSFSAAGLGLGVSAVRFGGELYSETLLGVSAGREVVPGVGIGIRCRLNKLSIEGYGSCLDVAFDAGLRVECLNGFVVGGSFTNLTGTTLGRTEEVLPQELAGGITYSPLSELHISFTVSKELLSPTEFRMGVEALICDPLTLRAGITDNPPAIACGCGIRAGDITADYSCTYHLMLGATHAIGVSVGFP